MKSFESLTLKHFLKKKLKERKITLIELAEKLEVSTPTLKRWLGSSEISFEVVNTILKILNISWSQVTEQIEKGQCGPTSLPLDIESFFAENPIETFLFLLISHRFSLERIKNKLDISEKKLQKMLEVLIEHGLIEKRRSGYYETLFSPPFHFPKDGPYHQAYVLKVVDIFLQEIRNSSFNFEQTFSPEKTLLIGGEMFLTKTSMTKFKAEMIELYRKYRLTSQVESELHFKNELFPTSVLLFSKELPLWEKVFKKREKEIELKRRM